MPDQNRNFFRQSQVESAESAEDLSGNGKAGICNVRKRQMAIGPAGSGSEIRTNLLSEPDISDLVSVEQNTPASFTLPMDFKEIPLRELIERFRCTKDEAVRTEFVRRTTPAIRGVAYRRLRDCGVRDLDSVQDLTNDTFIKLLKALERSFQWQGEGRFFGWIQTITINVVNDWLRRRKETAPLDEDMNIYEGSRFSEAQIIHRLRHAEIERSLEKIGAGKKETVIFLLFFKYRCAARMIAKMPDIDLSENQIETKLASLVRRIRRDLGNAPSSE